MFLSKTGFPFLPAVDEASSSAADGADGAGRQLRPLLLFVLHAADNTVKMADAAFTLL